MAHDTESSLDACQAEQQQFDPGSLHNAAKFAQRNSRVAAGYDYSGEGTTALGQAVRPSTTTERLMRHASQVERQADDAKRAADILIRHPEYEELLWLIRSGLV